MWVKIPWTEGLFSIFSVFRYYFNVSPHHHLSHAALSYLVTRTVGLLRAANMTKMLRLWWTGYKSLVPSINTSKVKVLRYLAKL